MKALTALTGLCVSKKKRNKFYSKTSIGEIPYACFLWINNPTDNGTSSML